MVLTQRGQYDSIKDKSSMQDCGKDSVITENHYQQVAKPTRAVINDSVRVSSSSSSSRISDSRSQSCSSSNSSTQPFGWSQSGDSRGDSISLVSSPGRLNGLRSCGKSTDCNACSNEKAYTTVTNSDFDMLMGYYCDLEAWSRQAGQNAATPSAMDVDVSLDLALPVVELGDDSSSSLSSSNHGGDMPIPNQSKSSFFHGYQMEDPPPLSAAEPADPKWQSMTSTNGNASGLISSSRSDTFSLPVHKLALDTTAVHAAAIISLVQPALVVSDNFEGSSSSQHKSRSSSAEDCFIPASCSEQEDEKISQRRASAASDAQLIPLQRCGNTPAALMPEARTLPSSGDPGPEAISADHHHQQELEDADYRQYQALEAPQTQHSAVSSAPTVDNYAVHANYYSSAPSWQPQQALAQTSCAELEQSKQLQQSDQPCPGEQSVLQPQYRSPISPYAQLQQSLHDFQQQYFTGVAHADTLMCPANGASVQGENNSDHAARPATSVSTTSASSSHRSTPSSTVSHHSAVSDPSQKPSSWSVRDGDWRSPASHCVPDASQHVQQLNQNHSAYPGTAHQDRSIPEQRRQSLGQSQQDSTSHFSQPPAWQALPNKYAGFDPDKQDGVSSISARGDPLDAYKGTRDARASPSPYQPGSHWHPQTQTQLHERQAGLTGLSSDTSLGIAPSIVLASQNIVRSPSSASSANADNTQASWAPAGAAPNQQFPSPFAGSSNAIEFRCRPSSSEVSHVPYVEAQSSNVSFPHQYAAHPNFVSSDYSGSNFSFNPNVPTRYTHAPHASTHNMATLSASLAEGFFSSQGYGQTMQAIPDIPQFPVDFSIDSLPLHFDYSQPGNPRPIDRPVARSKMSYCKKRSSTTPPSDTHGSLNNRNAPQDAPVRVPPVRSDTASSIPSASDSSDSGGSNFFNKGQKRRRPDPIPHPGSNAGPSFTSGHLPFISNQDRLETNGNAVGKCDRGGEFHPSQASTPSSQNRDALGYSSSLQDAIPQIAALQLDHTPSPNKLPSDAYKVSVPSEILSSASNASHESFSSMDDGADDGESADDAGAVAAQQRATNGRRLYECKLCSRKFPRPSALAVHERIHSGEKPFVCEFCNRPFTVASNLRRHQKIHAKEMTKQSEGDTKEKIASQSQSQSSDGSTIKGRSATEGRQQKKSKGNGVNHFEKGGERPSAAEPAIGCGSTTMSTISDGSDADSFDERSQEGSSIANDFALPAFNVRDFASEAAEVQSFLSMAQEAAVQRDSERIRQWSSSVV